VVLTSVRFGAIGKEGSGRVGDRLAANGAIDPIEARDDSRLTGGASRSAATLCGDNDPAPGLALGRVLINPARWELLRRMTLRSQRVNCHVAVK
jgi:hypothetical protein